MPDLIAQGVAPEHRWRRKLVPDQPCVLGREAGSWSAPWDKRISRQHVEIRWDGERLEVGRLSAARNPVFVGGHERDRFAIVPGEHFVIGETTFTLAEEGIRISLEQPQPAARPGAQAHSPRLAQMPVARVAQGLVRACPRAPPACGATSGPGIRQPRPPPPRCFSVLTEAGLPNRSCSGRKLSGRLRRLGSGW